MTVLEKQAAPPWSAEGMEGRRRDLLAKIRACAAHFLDEQAQWREGLGGRNDPRVYVQISLAFLDGTAADVDFAEKLLRNETVQGRINACSFTTEYLLAVLYGAGERMPEALREDLRQKLSVGLVEKYARKDLQHHGYNDNHVTLATSSLILAGQLTGNAEAVEEGRANLLNFRDTFLRRGFMHETNDCYIPHTLYSTAVVAEFAEDEEIRELARNCEARIWADWIGHWHVNLGRKVGPSARDYTVQRLAPLAQNVILRAVFGDEFGVGAYPTEDLFRLELPEERSFSLYNRGDVFWNLGLLARFLAHGYHVPDAVARLAYERRYPFVIEGTHEVGHCGEAAFREVTDAKGHPQLESRLLDDRMPFAAREIMTVQVQEADWAMGTASQRMLGNCPNNNWSVAYRKAAPLERTADQGLLFCSFTVNGKHACDDVEFQMSAETDGAVNREDFIHWHDTGRYAGFQQGGTAMMLYRPRPHEMHRISSLATTLVFPQVFGGDVEELHFGDRIIHNFQGESVEAEDIFITDGPVYIGIRPLLSRPQSSPIRLKASRKGDCALVDIFAYQGEPIELAEVDLCRIGGGFLCEVRNQSDFADLDAFKTWFRAGQILDDQTFFMRQVRYHRPGLDMAMRYDVWADQIMYRMVNGREWRPEPFFCSELDKAELPWLSGDLSGLDHFSWAALQAARPASPFCQEPGRLTSAGVV